LTQQLNYFWHAKCQNVKLRVFSTLPSLDKFVSGIPNAIRTFYILGRNIGSGRTPAFAITVNTN